VTLRAGGQVSPDSSKRVALSEDEVVDAALAVISRDGLHALSMRRMARELGRSQMAAYWYVDDKDGLIDLVVRKILSDVDIPTDADADWRDRLRTLIINLDEVVRDYPSMSSVLLSRMLTSDQHVVEAVMSILHDAGFDDRKITMAYAMVHTYLFGRYQVVTDRPETESFENLSPLLQRVVAELPHLHGRDYFEFGIDVLLDGLAARLEQ